MLQGDAMWEMNATHHKELLRVAETQRPLARVRARPQQAFAHLLYAIGDAMVVAGSRLKARNAHMTQKVI